MLKIPSTLACVLLIAIAMLISVPEFMAAGTTPIVQPIGSFSGGIASVGQPIALFTGVLPVGINQGKGLFSGQLPTPTALGSLNAKRTTIQLDQAMPSVSSIPEGLNTPPVVTKPLNLTVPMVAGNPLNKSEPEVVTVSLNGTKPLNATNPMNTTQPMNTTMP